MKNILNIKDKIDNLDDFSKLLLINFCICDLDDSNRKTFISSLLSSDNIEASDILNLLIGRINELSEDDLSTLLDETYKALDKKFDDEAIKR